MGQTVGRWLLYGPWVCVRACVCRGWGAVMGVWQAAGPRAWSSGEGLGLKLDREPRSPRTEGE